jgi:hypothetical protein
MNPRGFQATDNTPRALGVCRMDSLKFQAIDNTPRALGVYKMDFPNFKRQTTPLVSAE